MAARLTVVTAATVSLLTCGGLLIYGSGRGFDLTDETFYLVWTRDPQAHQLMYQPFGYLLHPLFECMGENLRAYRLSGFAIAAGAGGLLGSSIPCPRHTGAAMATYGAAAALTIFFPWIITPSYNSAADVGAMLIIAGIMNTRRDGAADEALGAIALAAGLCIAAFSKPPLLVITCLFVVGAAVARRNLRAFVTAASGLLLGAGLTCLFIAPLQISATVQRIIASQHVLGLPNTVEKLPVKIMRDWLSVPVPLTGAAACAFASFALHRSRWFSWAGLSAVTLSVYYLVSVAADAVDNGAPDFVGLALVTLAAGYAGLLQHRRGVPNLAINMLLCAPFTIALGTFNNQWFQFNFSLVFPFVVLFVLALHDDARARRVIALGFAAFAPIATMLAAAWHPYSLPESIFQQQTQVAPPLARGTVRVDSETAAFIQDAHGLAQGRLLIDLSGSGPGVAAVIGARSPVVAWLNPATPTWPDVVWSRLNERQRRSAWFVAPVWPSFGHSAPARWLAAHESAYCATDLPEMPFWGEEKTLQLWGPCEQDEIDHSS